MTLTCKESGQKIRIVVVDTRKHHVQLSFEDDSNNFTIERDEREAKNA
jgi:hypothetical protein